MNTFSLNENWKLCNKPLYFDKEYYYEILGEGEWMDAGDLPCDVHMPLIKNGVINDPVIADNAEKSEWIEDKSWWFKKVFDADDDLIDSFASEMVIEGLDVKADIFINGKYLGHHLSAMYPFREDVRDYLIRGENILIIRVTSGLEYFSELDISKIKDYVACEYKGGRGPRGDNRRVMLRKPQYVYGWDWTPRIATCGITGSAFIEVFDDVALRDVNFRTEKLIGNQADISVTAKIENLNVIGTIDAKVTLEILYDNKVIIKDEKDSLLRSGYNYIEFKEMIKDPYLWWPNGAGDQNLYDICVNVETQSMKSVRKEIKAGVRTLSLITDRIDEDNRLFLIEVNGVRLFCKGANWETPDSIYARISDEKYKELILEAKEANFNMLRFNGTNAYERDFFYDLCDKHGILIWQDFAGFSCGAYPDELTWFKKEVQSELEYQTIRLRNHPCIALWCGNNECNAHLALYRSGGYWAGDKKPASSGGMVIYNEMMPKIIRNNSPYIPYWNSSPYGGKDDLNCDEYGDVHNWVFMSSNMEERITPEEYDKVKSKFVSEFGCIGPVKKSSLYQYYGSQDIDVESNIWKMHTNTFEKNTIKAAIAKHYTKKQDLSLDEYLLYAGLFQGMMLGYALESMRIAQNNYGALIWSFNDAWGEIGWSIIDYYLIRKIAYYFVKRALAHKKLMMRQDEDNIMIYCSNDTNERLEIDVEYGYVSFDGKENSNHILRVIIEPFTKTQKLVCFKKGGFDIHKGVFYVKPVNDETLDKAILRAIDFKKLKVPKCDISMIDHSVTESYILIKSSGFAHGVHFSLDDRTKLSDEYFEMLPGETKKVYLYNVKAGFDFNSIKPKAITSDILEMI